MKKNRLLSLGYLLISTIISAQQQPVQLNWLNTAPSYLNGGSFSAQGVTNLSDGSVVVVGYFQHTVDFDPGPDTFNLTTTAYYGIFVAKYNNQGKLAFAYGFSESNLLSFDENYESANAVTTDADDNIYVTGTFRGDVDFDPDSGKTILSASHGSANNFIACYTKNGKFKFAKNITAANGYENVASVVSDKNKNIYVTGSFEGSDVDFDPGPNSTHSVAKETDIFFSKYDSAGNFKFVKILSGVKGDYANKIVLDKNNNIIICGFFYSAYLDVSADTIKHFLQRKGDADLFFAKYDTSGKLIFAENIGNYKSSDASSVAIGTDNNIVLTGKFYGTSVDFDPLNPGKHLLTSQNSYDAFIAKYDADGNCAFAFSIGNGSPNDNGVDIGLDSNNNIFCTGEFGGKNVDFDPGTGIYGIPTSKDGDYYLAKYTYSGNFVSAVATGGQTSGVYYTDFRINCLHVTPTGKTLTAGYFSGKVDLDAGTDSTIVNEPATTMFVCKYDNANNFLSEITGNNYYDYAFPYSTVTSSAIDKNGNLYVCGNFDGQYDFDPGPGIYTLASSVNVYGSNDQNGFFAKYDSKGNLMFAKSINGGNSINDIAVDNKGNVYLTGKSDGFTDFDPGSGVYYLNHIDTADPYRYYNFFIAKYDSNGDLIYAKGNGNNVSYYLNVTSIALDAKNNICIAGILNGSIDFDPGVNTHILNGNTGLGNMFIAKYDSACNYQFSYCIKNTSSTGTVSDIKFDNKNNIVFTGIFYGNNLDFDPGPNTFLLSSGSVYSAGFISIYKNNGAFVSAIPINGQEYLNDQFASLTTDNTGNIFIAGNSTNIADFDPGPGTAFLPDAHEAYFASYNNKLQFRFLKGLASYWGFYYDGNNLNAITLDKYNNIYVAGEFTSKTIDCDPGPDTALLMSNYNNGSNSNLFIAKYDSLGNYIYSNQFKTDSAIGGNVSASILVHDNGSIYYTGTAVSKINFATGNRKVYLQPTTFGGNVFIAQYHATTMPSKISNSIAHSKNIISNQVKVYPNPITDKVNIQLNNIKQNNAIAIISLYDVNGKLIQTNKTTFSNHTLNTTIKLPKNLSVGSYFITINVEGKIYYSGALIK